jgi:SAM-dependent methyltransferase/glycosyltransferase involved in cell wall biosynthesis
MNRAVYGAWQVRPDLQASFPQPLGADETALLSWARVSALAEAELVPELLPDPVGASTHGWRASSEAGVNVSGYLTAELGMGQCGRLVVDAVRESGLPFSTTTWSRTLSRKQEAFEDVDEGVRYPVNVAMVNADQIPAWAEEVGRDLVTDRYTIGVWAWEVEEFPATYGEALQIVDEVWAISAFVRDAIARVTAKPVHVFPVPAGAPAQPPAPLDRAALGLPAGPMFLFAFDYLSVFERKNPLAVVDAFCRAFDEAEAPILVIKTINGDKARTDRERLRTACEGRSDIFLIEEYLSGQIVKSLMADATCYVSLHRSEGYGLTLSEAMTLGVPVIATGYSGNLDFMTEDDSLLVPYELVPVAPGSGPYPVTTRWADPDVSVAATYMRKIFDDPAFAESLGQRGRIAVLSRARVDRAAEFVKERVAAAMEDLERHPERFAAKARLTTGGGALNRARTMIRTPLDSDTPSRLPFGLARRLRRVVNRLLTHHDQQVNERLEALADAIALTGAETAGVAARVDDLHNDIWGRFGDLSGRLEATNARTEQLDAEMVARPFMTDPSQLVQRDELGREYLGLSPANSEASYKGFEDVFRGSEAFVADRLQPYLGLLRDKAPILDVGCGRGELLGLLDAVGVAASGVDLDPSMLARCEAKGLDVQLGDAVEVLHARAPGSLGAVTSFQVVEHIELGPLRALFQASYRALRPGGVMVAETVNPHSPAALKAFWLDLTHIRPLYPEALLFLARESGFPEARIFFPLGTGDLDHDLRTCGEYALVATKG